MVGFLRRSVSSLPIAWHRWIARDFHKRTGCSCYWTPKLCTETLLQVTKGTREHIEDLRASSTKPSFWSSMLSFFLWLYFISDATLLSIRCSKRWELSVWQHIWHQKAYHSYIYFTNIVNHCFLTVLGFFLIFLCSLLGTEEIHHAKLLAPSISTG